MMFPLASAATDYLEISVSEQTVTKSKWTVKRKVLVAFLTLVGISLIVIMPTLFWQLHEANKALHGFCDALIAKQYKPAYDLTSKEFQASVDFQKFTKVHDDLALRVGDLKSVEITHSEVKEQRDGWYGTAETTMTFTRGTLNFTYILKKNDGHWRVYSYHEE
jgi:hypothetical protein